jgi:glycosyltransferase involved in cell wall biosynthesis
VTGLNRSDKQAVFLSIAVCTYNRADLLEACLISLGRQVSTDSVEVIIVDNKSTDETLRVAHRMCDRYSFMIYCLEQNQGLQHARNCGFKMARGRYIAYLDDDAIAPANYISSLLSTLRSKKPDILGGPIYPYYTCTKPKWFKDEYEIRRFADRSGFSKTCRISGSNFVIRKSVLEQLGRFDVSLGIVGNRLGMGGERAVIESYRHRKPEASQKIFYDLDAYVYHYVPVHKMTLRYQIKRMFLSGRAMATIHGFNLEYLCLKIIARRQSRITTDRSASGTNIPKPYTMVDLMHALVIRLGLLYGIACNAIAPPQMIHAPFQKD